MRWIRRRPLTTTVRWFVADVTKAFWTFWCVLLVRASAYNVDTSVREERALVLVRVSPKSVWCTWTNPNLLEIKSEGETASKVNLKICHAGGGGASVISRIKVSRKNPFSIFSPNYHLNMSIFPKKLSWFLTLALQRSSSKFEPCRPIFSLKVIWW